MKRELQKKIKDKEKALEKAIKILAKKKGYKSLMGSPYKIIDGFLYEALISTSLSDKPNLFIYIQSKPLALDDLYWKIFNMYEEAKKQPESFHIKGAFTANSVTIDKFYKDFLDEEDQEVVAEQILDTVTLLIEKSREKIVDIDTFEKFIYDKPNQDLNKMLISIIKKDYLKAEKIIDHYIEKDISAGFMSGGGWKTIMEYAKEFLEKVKNE